MESIRTGTRSLTYIHARENRDTTGVPFLIYNNKLGQYISSAL
jgi:hypothetical protein